MYGSGGAGLRIKKLAVLNHVSRLMDRTAESSFRVNELARITTGFRVLVSGQRIQGLGQMGWLDRAGV